MFHYLTAVFWWRWAQVGFQRWFLRHEESFIMSFNCTRSLDFQVLSISSRTNLWLKHYRIVIIHISILIKSLKRRLNTNLLFLNLLVSHLRILLSLSLCHRRLSCLRRYQTTVLQHDVLHWRILTSIWELYFILII